MRQKPECTPPPPTSATVLYDLLIALDTAAANVWQDGSPWQAGVREGLERAAAAVRDALARVVAE